MSETEVIRPGKRSLFLTVVVIAIMLALAIGIGVTPDPQGAGRFMALLMAVVAILVGALLGYIRATTRLVLEQEGLIYTRVGTSLRLEWSQISGVEGKVIAGSKSDQEYAVLTVPELEAILQKNPQLSKFKSPTPGEVRIGTNLFDEGTGEIVERIRKRLSPTEPTSVSAPAARRSVPKRLPTFRPVTFRAWYAWGGVATFGLFFGFGVYILATKHQDPGGLILGLIFALVFGPLAAMGVAIASIERVQMQRDYLTVCYPGLEMKVAWQDITGVMTVGSYSAQILIVEIVDYQAYLDLLPAKTRSAMINLLAGRGEGIPIKRDMMPVTLQRLAFEIGRRAGL